MVCITKFCLNSPSFHTYYQCQSLDLYYFTWMSSLTQSLKGVFHYLLTSYIPVQPLLSTRISYLTFLWMLISYNIKTHSVDISSSKLQEIMKDREAWHAEVHGVAKSQTWVSHWTTSLNSSVCFFSPAVLIILSTLDSSPDCLCPELVSARLGYLKPLLLSPTIPSKLILLSRAVLKIPGFPSHLYTTHTHMCVCTPLYPPLSPHHNPTWLPSYLCFRFTSFMEWDPSLLCLPSHTALGTPLCYTLQIKLQLGLCVCFFSKQ